MKKYFLIFGLCLVSNLTIAAPLTAQQLMSECQQALNMFSGQPLAKPQAIQAGYCLGYVTAVSTTMLMNAHHASSATFQNCLLQANQPAQARKKVKLFVNYLKNHSKAEQQLAVTVIQAALKNHFSVPKRCL